MSDAYILGGVRTPIGKFLGGLSKLSAPELGAAAIRECLARLKINPARVDEVIMGNVLSAGLGQAPARQAALGAGLPNSVAAVTVNKVCGSGLKAVMLAAQAVRLEDAEIVIAGGMESMSGAPHVAHGLRRGKKLGEIAMDDVLLKDGLVCAFGNCHMGRYAERTAREHNVTRQDQDQYALTSQSRAAEAVQEGWFGDEIVPMADIDHDEGPRPETTLDGLAQLKPAFEETGSVTAGNASMLSDGAAAVVVCREKTARETAAPWKAKIIASHTSGTAPEDLFIAPVGAVQGVLRKAGLTAKDIDLFEINEAFASQMVACLRGLNLDPERVNIHGGAIAVGHPIGASGARILVTLLAALKQRHAKRGIASLCLGGGNAVAMLIERVDF